MASLDSCWSWFARTGSRDVLTQETECSPQFAAEGGPFEAGSQAQVSSHRKLLSSRARVVSVEKTLGPDPGRQG